MKRTTTGNKVGNKIRVPLMVVLMCASMFALSSCGTNEIIDKDSLEADTAEGRVPASEMASPFDSQSSEGTGSSSEPEGLDALRERVAKEYESDWGMYSLTANEDLSIMYDWHMAGSYEGGTYYKVTDSGFELITEWVYDSIEDCYTIDDRSATQDEVNRLNEEMNASVYNLQ